MLNKILIASIMIGGFCAYAQTKDIAHYCHDSNGTTTPLLITNEDGQSVPAQPILFELNRDKLSESSLLALDAVARMLLAHPEISLIQIDGHTDATGSVNYNDALSMRRISAVRNYLISRGIEQYKLLSKCHGSRDPLVPNDNSQNMAKNRRVEISVLTRIK